MTNPQPHLSDPPTPKQLRYLKGLAFSRGQSFAYPKTSAEASREIKRLKNLKAEDRFQRHREISAVRRAMAERRGDAASVRDAELSGYGSAASWAGGAGA